MHKAQANSMFNDGVLYVQVEDATDKLVTRERDVAMLGGTGPDISDEL
jgi:hypothetical protein